MPKVNFVKVGSLDELTFGLEKSIIIHLLVYVGQDMIFSVVSFYSYKTVFVLCFFKRAINLISTTLNKNNVCGNLILCSFSTRLCCLWFVCSQSGIDAVTNISKVSAAHFRGFFFIYITI